MEIRTQWRTSGFGLIGLDYNVVYKEAERLDIDLSQCLFKKIKLIEQIELKRASDAAVKSRSEGRNEPNQVVKR